MALTRILVTGAAGFVGGHLLPALRRGFPDAWLIATSQQGEEVAGADATVALDLSEFRNLDGFVREVSPSACVHLAARANVPTAFRDPEQAWRVNLQGTVSLAEALLRVTPQCVFILASSAEVYGLTFQKGVPVTEDSLMAPANPYAASKAAADLAVGEMALRGLRAVRLRSFNHTGPGQSETFVVASFAKQIAMIEAGLAAPAIRVGALDRWRDFLDVRDVCSGYVAALMNAEDLEPGVAVNLASGRARHIRAILQDLQARADLDLEVNEEPGRMRSTDVAYTLGDASRARALLAWAPAVSWDRTLDDVLSYWRARVRG